jgi:AbrB family looped-hinge helix DNA binding protein
MTWYSRKQGASGRVRKGGLAVKKLAKITSKGQITVPHEIRRALGARPGDKLLFEKEGSSIRVQPVRTKSPLKNIEASGAMALLAAERPSCNGCVNYAGNDHRD